MNNKSIFSDREKLTKIVNESSSIKEIIEKMELGTNGRNSETLKKYAKLYDLELPQYKPTGFNKIKITDEEIFKENSRYKKRDIIKRKLIEKGLKEECSKCGLPPEWNGAKLTLQLEHINGVPNDNRIENLTLLCPNCHSQTETFAGRKANKKNLEEIICTICNTNSIFSLKLKRCEDCHEKIINENRAKKYNIDYPEFDGLKSMIEKYGYAKSATIIGVSDNGLKKHIIKVLPDGEEMPKYITKENRHNKA